MNVFQGILYGGKTGVTIGGPLGGAAGVIIGGAIGYFSGQWLSDVILNEITDDGEGCDNNRHSPDQQALNDLIDEQTLGGRRPLSEEDANTILDWGEELGIDGIRDDRGKDHWKVGNHIHVPGSGTGHIPTK